MKSNQPMIFLIELVLICVVAYSQTDSSPKRSIDEIANAALQTAKAYNEGEADSHRHPDGLEHYEFDIPQKYWTDIIKELKPVKVYEYMGCVAIVLSLHRDSVEDGIFVLPFLSEYLPVEGYVGNDRFEFNKYMQWPGNVWKFRRTPVQSEKKD